MRVTNNFWEEGLSDLKAPSEQKHVSIEEIVCLGDIGCLGGGNSNIFHFHPELWGR